MLINVNRGKKIFILGLFFISLYLFIFKLPFAGIDDLFFKQPGLNLIRGYGLSAPELTGSFLGIEKVWVQYPPVYPFIFGLWFLLFGFTISSSLCLSFLICGAIAFIQVLLFESVLSKKLPAYIYGLIFFSWTIAIKASHRPDALLTMLGLSLFLLIIRKASGKIAVITHLIIILLMGLALGTSPALGAFLMLQLSFLLIVVKGVSLQTIKIFSLWCSFAVLLCVLLWWIPLQVAPHLFISQFIKAAFFDDIYTYNFLEAGPADINTCSFLKKLQEGIKFNFQYGWTLFYIPLIAGLTLLFATGAFWERDKAKRDFLIWQFLGIVLIWILMVIIMPYKYTYQQAFFAFFVFICGVASLRVFESLRNLYLKNILILTLFFCLGIAYLPFLRTVAFPLTWGKQDAYAYNKELILDSIPKGSKILTDVRFWYIFNNDYEIFDLFYGHANIYRGDYVLLVSGGSGQPEAAPLLLSKKEASYFHKHFLKQLSTMSNEPNKLFGFPIAKSRWCYRFELYKRK